MLSRKVKVIITDVCLVYICMQFIKFLYMILKHSECTQSFRACVLLRNNFIQ